MKEMLKRWLRALADEFGKEGSIDLRQEDKQKLEKSLRSVKEGFVKSLTFLLNFADQNSPLCIWLVSQALRSELSAAEVAKRIHVDLVTSSSPFRKEIRTLCELLLRKNRDHILEELNAIAILYSRGTLMHIISRVAIYERCKRLKVAQLRKIINSKYLRGTPLQEEALTARKERHRAVIRSERRH